LADSSKHIIQIVQLLEERSMSFSFCLNKNEMLTLCGLSILYQGLDLKQEGKLMQESQRLITSVIQLLVKVQAPGAADFRRLACSMIKLDLPPLIPQHRNTNDMAAPSSSKSTPSPPIARQQLRPQMYRQYSASVSETDLLSQQEKLRRATVPHIALARQEYAAHSRTSKEATRSESPMSRREYNPAASTLPTVIKRRSINSEKPPNLDYLSLSNTPAISQPQSPIHSRNKPPMQPQNRNSNPLLTSMFPHNTYSNPPKSSVVSSSEWEVLLGSLDGGQTNLYDAIYGGPALSLSENTNSSYSAWSPDSPWDMATLNMSDFTSAPAPRSVLSFSEESLSSGEDLSSSEIGLGGGRAGDYGSSLLPGSVGSGESYLLDGLEGTFGL
jgi:hypothetical protein